MCLKVMCEKASLWARILADSENCATCACMTNVCLETAENKGQQRDSWNCPTMEMTVCRHRTENELPMPQSETWCLEDLRAYWIGRLESGLQATVRVAPGIADPRLYISISGMSEKTLARLGAMGRLSKHHNKGHIRDKQIESWPAEDVIVLSRVSGDLRKNLTRPTRR